MGPEEYICLICAKEACRSRNDLACCESASWIGFIESSNDCENKRRTESAYPTHVSAVVSLKSRHLPSCQAHVDWLCANTSEGLRRTRLKEVREEAAAEVGYGR